LLRSIFGGVVSVYGNQPVHLVLMRLLRSLQRLNPLPQFVDQPAVGVDVFAPLQGS
jgi:hypothetical protein